MCSAQIFALFFVRCALYGVLLCLVFWGQGEGPGNIQNIVPVGLGVFLRSAVESST